MFDWLKKKPEKVEFVPTPPPPLRKVLFLCDRKACGSECPNPDCMYTTAVAHAKNFKRAEQMYNNTEYHLDNLFVEVDNDETRNATD